MRTPTESLLIAGLYVVIAAATLGTLTGCPKKDEKLAEAPSHIRQARADVQTGSDGLTNEQRNIKDRYKMDSIPGTIKHLYVQSAYTGDVLLYSTVRGKVTSSGKRLSPTTVYAGALETTNSPLRRFGIPTSIGDGQYTTEVLQDDGTFGSSIDYLYWWDAQGRYHQHYPNGGQLIHITNEPLPVKKAFLRFEEPHKAAEGAPEAHK
jgi:hypothetical protein